jgi:hypothetical protein
MPPKKTAHKRALSVAKESGPASIKRSRQSPRVKKATPSSSKVIKSANSGSESPESSEVEDASDYEELEQVEEPSESEGSEAVEVESDSSEGQATGSTRKLKSKPSQSRKSDQTSTTAAHLKFKSQDLLKPGVKTGLGPGTQIVIRKPKARVAGDTRYSDDTIHPNTMLFLGDLAANNEREWLKGKSSQIFPLVLCTDGMDERSDGFKKCGLCMSDETGAGTKFASLIQISSMIA